MHSERARSELAATGLAATRAEAPGALARLTRQEYQVAVLAAQGRFNREIAAQLLMSHRTVGYHLYKAYPKLGIASRAQLADVFAQATSASHHAPTAPGEGEEPENQPEAYSFLAN